ncbi:SusC/RagA family TonB-linked outer membrane protein [Chryseobacterium defluvii]|uniref:TonB-linked SusC/RagA family outer membrane protein n=1 Tax=Chryseobacterium defluvii TaxID=160396 RepID=A0A495SPZ8_9FLAO|nr:SusC/RagA family TonB-linked outer membrane protein [Chryseobacterium defluvii]RKT01755.1 TonB-linked SusC/RagA family outer membrane protein [Chryseobacterium defluvii]
MNNTINNNGSFISFQQKKNDKIPMITKWRVMLLRALFLCLLIFLYSLSMGQKISLELSSASFKSTIQQIQKQSGYSFSINDRHMRISKPVNISAKNQDILEVLPVIFNQQPFGYSVDGKIVISIDRKNNLGKEKEKVNPSGFRQPAFRGKVVNERGEPLPGATIRIKKTGEQFSTDSEGNFEIPIQFRNEELQISYIGYSSLEKIGEDATHTVLVPLQNTLGIAEVVSTGYQTIPKERATGSFAIVDNKLFNMRVSPNLIDRLEGNVPGLIFHKNTSSSTENGVDINIRGHSTLFASDQPLIILDNFPYDGDLRRINPNDIENITVLKDAAATSIWGAKSGNGVIVITTKKGKRNQKPNIELNSNVTIGAKPDVYYNKNFINADDFINIEQELFDRGFYNNDLASLSMPVISPVVDILDKKKRNIISSSEAEKAISELRNVDVRKEIEKYFYQKSVNQQYSVNIKGGGDNIDYFVSLGADHNRSNLVGNTDSRYTVNVKTNINLTKRLLASINYMFVQSGSKQNYTLGNLSPYSKSVYPYMKLSDENGGHLATIKEFNTNYIDTAGGGKFYDWQYRPLDELGYANDKSRSTDNLVNLSLKYDFSKSLSAEIKYQFGKSTSQSKGYSSEQTYSTRTLINKFTYFDESGNPVYPVPKGGMLDQTYSTLTTKNLRAQINYNKSWNVHELTAIAGAEINDVVKESDFNTYYGYDLNTGSFTTPDFVTNFETNPSSSSLIPYYPKITKFTDHFISYFSNAAYTYDGKYTFSVSGRIDKSNLFGVNTNQKGVPLYSIGGSWNLSKESFYHLDWIPYLRLRTTYGYSGNVDKNVTAVTTIRQLNNYYYSRTPYAQVVNPGNPDLRWEKIKTVNFGVDYASKNNRISGSIEYFIKTGLDLFGDMPLAGSTGWPNFRGNYARTKGRGWDVVLNTKNIVTTNFEWNTQLQLSKAQDFVTKYDVKEADLNYLTYGSGNFGAIMPLEGKPLFAIYAFKSGPLTHDTGDPQGFLDGKLTTDYSSIFNKTPLDSMVYAGPSRPTVFGSLRNTLTFKRFSLSFNILYKFNYYFRRNSIFYSSLFNSWNGHEDFSDRWQKPGDENVTNIPSIQYPPMNTFREGFYANSESLVTKGDHIRLQDIMLSYDIDKSAESRLPFAHLQLYCYINNIGIIWRSNKQGLDPDLFGNGLPQPRSIALGLRANF